MYNVDVSFYHLITYIIYLHVSGSQFRTHGSLMHNAIDYKGSVHALILQIFCMR